MLLSGGVPNLSHAWNNMPRADRVRSHGEVRTHGEALQMVKAPGDTVVVRRGIDRSLVMMCPCGCGSPITINLDSRVDKAWRVYSRRHGLSLYPSVWRDSGCESHFVVWANRICWIDTDWWDYAPAEDGDIENKILREVSAEEFIHFRDLAATLDEIPWDVLRACRRLSARGQLEEGHWDHREQFKAVVRDF